MIKIRILVIEDEAIVRFYLTLTLSKINGEIVDVKCAEDAIELLEKDKNFDLIITDVQMYEMNGFQLIDELEKKGIKIPIVVESAYLADDENMVNYKDKVKAFVKKPIDLNLLELIIRQLEEELNHSSESTSN